MKTENPRVVRITVNNNRTAGGITTLYILILTVRTYIIRVGNTPSFTK